MEVNTEPKWNKRENKGLGHFLQQINTAINLKLTKWRDNLPQSVQMIDSDYHTPAYLQSRVEEIKVSVTLKLKGNHRRDVTIPINDVELSLRDILNGIGFIKNSVTKSYKKGCKSKVLTFVKNFIAIIKNPESPNYNQYFINAMTMYFLFSKSTKWRIDKEFKQRGIKIAMREYEEQFAEME